MTARRAILGLCTTACVLAAPAAVARAGGEPTVKSVRPLALRAGERLVIGGSNFSPAATRVFFVRIDGDGTAWTAPDRATARKLVVTVPAALGGLLGGAAARFHLRLLTTRFGRPTSRELSPLVLPGPGPRGGIAADWLGAIGAPK